MFCPREFYQNSPEEVSVQSMPGAESNRSVSCSTLLNDLQVCQKKEKKKERSKSEFSILKYHQNKTMVFISQLLLGVNAI